MPRTRSGASSARVTYDTPEEQAYSDYIEGIRAKTVVSSPIIDLSVVDELGIRRDFQALTRRVGFGPGFWAIAAHCRAFEELTQDFLASVTFYEADDGDDYIRFFMMGELRQVHLSTMRIWFQLATPDTSYFGYSPEGTEDEDTTTARSEFWYRITGRHLAGSSSDPRVNRIIHPTLRFICRALALTIFARGESSLRPTHDDLRLLATMVRPDEQLQRPDLMSLMVRHWISIRGHGRVTGQITCGSYITCIASYLQLDIFTDTSTRDPTTVDIPRLRAYGWISYESAPTRTGRSITWHTAESGDFILPLLDPIDPYDDRTWRLEDVTPDEADEDPPEADVPEYLHQHHSPAMDHSPPHQGPETHHVPPQAPGAWSLPVMYTMMTDMHSCMRRLETGQQHTHAQLREVRAAQRSTDDAVHQLTTRVADLEVDAGHRRRRHRRGDPGASTSARD